MRVDVGQSRFFKDQTYHFLTLRVLGNEPYGGEGNEGKGPQDKDTQIAQIKGMA
jgi:hypothetical protein